MTFKLATIETDGRPRAAIVVEDRVLDIARATGREDDRDMLALLSTWEATRPRLAQLSGDASAAWQPLDRVKLLAPITNPGGIYCAGANYSDHAAEMAARANQPPPPDPRTLGLRSWHFLKNMHALAAPNATVRRHPRSQRIDWEAELAVVIGRKGRDISAADAASYIMGYTIANDLSARDLGRREGLPDSSSFKQDWVAHKNWDGSCPLGPWITLAEDVPNPHDLSIRLDVNGVEKQNSNSGLMIFDIFEQIADISRNITLHPGDIILTGTPAGVGAGRGEFLQAGDVVRIRIDRLGELVTTIA